MNNKIKLIPRKQIGGQIPKGQWGLDVYRDVFKNGQWLTAKNGTRYRVTLDGSLQVMLPNGKIETRLGLARKVYNDKIDQLENIQPTTNTTTATSKSANKLANQNSDVKDGNRKSGRISGKVNGNKSTSTSIQPTSTPETTYTPTVPKSMEYANDYLTASTPDTASSAYNTLAQNVLSNVDKRIAEISPRINSTDPYGEMMNAMKGWDLKRKQKMMDASVGTAWDWNTEEGRKAFTGMAQYLKNGKGDYQKAYDQYLASQNTPKQETLNNNFYANLSNDVKNMKLNLPKFKFTFDPESPTFAQQYTPPQLNLKLNATSNTPFVNYSGPDAWLDDQSWKKDLNSAYNRYQSTFARKGTKLIPRNNGFK